MITFKTILDVLGFNIRTSMIAITDTFKYIYASNFEATYIAETCMWYAMTNRLWPLSLSLSVLYELLSSLSTNGGRVLI